MTKALSFKAAMCDNKPNNVQMQDRSTQRISPQPTGLSDERAEELILEVRLAIRELVLLGRSHGDVVLDVPAMANALQVELDERDGKIRNLRKLG